MSSSAPERAAVIALLLVLTLGAVVASAEEPWSLPPAPASDAPPDAAEVSLPPAAPAPVCEAPVVGDVGALSCGEEWALLEQLELLLMLDLLLSYEIFAEVDRPAP